MSSIFNSLSSAYSGLSAAQVGIETTSHNISNAEVDGYTRQVVRTSASAPIGTSSGLLGTGTEVTDVKRIFDNFVFDQYRSISSDKEYSDFSEKTLEQLSRRTLGVDDWGNEWSEIAKRNNISSEERFLPKISLFKSVIGEFPQREKPKNLLPAFFSIKLSSESVISKEILEIPLKYVFSTS